MNLLIKVTNGPTGCQNSFIKIRNGDVSLISPSGMPLCLSNLMGKMAAECEFWLSLIEDNANNKALAICRFYQSRSGYVAATFECSQWPLSKIAA